MRIAYFDCFSGISGDMTIGAFLDAGLDFKLLEKELKKLNLKEYSLSARKVKRNGIAGTKFDCIVSGKARHHRSLKDVLGIIDKSSLKPRVKDTAKAVFTNIGRAEAKVHGVKFGGNVKFHELGDIDSIVDITGAAIAIDALGIDEIHSSPVTIGRGLIDTYHGKLPVPAPASLELLKGVPVDTSEVRGELVTPTGAGILKTLAKGFGKMPQMLSVRIGYGAGAREFEGVPNMLRVIIGEATPAFIEDRIFVIETNIDDMTPQSFGYVFEKLFDEGALDVYVTNIQMKKSRPAFKLTVLCDDAGLDRITKAIFRETTSIGVRFYGAGRYKLDRKTIKAKTRYGAINVKVSTGGDGIKTISPEYDECVKVARAKRIPLKDIYENAKSAVGNLGAQS